MFLLEIQMIFVTIKVGYKFGKWVHKAQTSIADVREEDQILKTETAHYEASNIILQNN